MCYPTKSGKVSRCCARPATMRALRTLLYPWTTVLSMHEEQTRDGLWMELFQRRPPVWSKLVLRLCFLKSLVVAAVAFVNDFLNFGSDLAWLRQECLTQSQLVPPSARMSPYHSRHSAPKSTTTTKFNKLGGLAFARNVSTRNRLWSSMKVSRVQKLQPFATSCFAVVFPCAFSLVGWNRPECTLSSHRDFPACVTSLSTLARNTCVVDLLSDAEDVLDTDAPTAQCVIVGDDSAQPQPIKFFELDVVEPSRITLMRIVPVEHTIRYVVETLQELDSLYDGWMPPPAVLVVLLTVESKIGVAIIQTPKSNWPTLVLHFPHDRTRLRSTLPHRSWAASRTWTTPRQPGLCCGTASSKVCSGT